MNVPTYLLAQNVHSPPPMSLPQKIPARNLEFNPIKQIDKK